MLTVDRNFTKMTKAIHDFEANATLGITAQKSKAIRKWVMDQMTDGAVDTTSLRKDTNGGIRLRSDLARKMNEEFGNEFQLGNTTDGDRDEALTAIASMAIETWRNKPWRVKQAQAEAQAQAQVQAQAQAQARGQAQVGGPQTPFQPLRWPQNTPTSAYAGTSSPFHPPRPSSNQAYYSQRQTTDQAQRAYRESLAPAGFPRGSSLPPAPSPFRQESSFGRIFAPPSAGNRHGQYNLPQSANPFADASRPSLARPVTSRSVAGPFSEGNLERASAVATQLSPSALTPHPTVAGQYALPQLARPVRPGPASNTGQSQQSSFANATPRRHQYVPAQTSIGQATHPTTYFHGDALPSPNMAPSSASRPRTNDPQGHQATIPRILRPQADEPSPPPAQPTETDQQGRASPDLPFNSLLTVPGPSRLTNNSTTNLHSMLRLANPHTAPGKTNVTLTITRSGATDGRRVQVVLGKAFGPCTMHFPIRPTRMEQIIAELENVLGFIRGDDEITFTMNDAKMRNHGQFIRVTEPMRLEFLLHEYVRQNRREVPLEVKRMSELGKLYRPIT